MKANPEGMKRLVRAIELAYEAFMKNKSVAIRATAANLGVNEDVARHIVDINPTLALTKMVDPGFVLSLTPSPPNPGAAGMIQQVGDFLLGQGIIKNKIDGGAAVDARYVAEYFRTKR